MVFAATTVPPTVRSTVVVPATGTWFVTTTAMVEAVRAAFAVTVGVAYDRTGGDGMIPCQARAISPDGAGTTTRLSTAPEERLNARDARPSACVASCNGPLKIVALTLG